MIRVFLPTMSLRLRRPTDISYSADGTEFNAFEEFFSVILIVFFFLSNSMSMLQFHIMHCICLSLFKYHKFRVAFLCFELVECSWHLAFTELVLQNFEMHIDHTLLFVQINEHAAISCKAP